MTEETIACVCLIWCVIPCLSQLMFFNFIIFPILRVISPPTPLIIICSVILSNDGYVQHLRPETFIVLRQMRNDLDGYDGQMDLGTNVIKFPDVHLIVERKPRKKLQPVN